MTATGQLSHKVFPGLYRDSVALMSLAREIEGMDGVIRVGAMMATPANQTILFQCHFVGRRGWVKMARGVSHGI